MTAGIYVAAALAEIAGCFAFWAWWKQGASVLWLLPGVAALIAFGWLLALTPADAAGRSYAAYGGVYIVASLLWLWLAEGQAPRLTDVAGAALALAGAGVILWGAGRGV